MIFLELVEWIVVILVVVGLFYQVVIPLWRGTPLFPSFRKERREIQHRLTDAKGDIELAELEKEAREAEKQARQVKKNVGR